VSTDEKLRSEGKGQLYRNGSGKDACQESLGRLSAAKEGRNPKTTSPEGRRMSEKGDGREIPALFLKEKDEVWSVKGGATSEERHFDLTRERNFRKRGS